MATLDTEAFPACVTHPERVGIWVAPDGLDRCHECHEHYWTSRREYTGVGDDAE